jgi:ethanolamine ammonia-lyase large subunit
MKLKTSLYGKSYQFKGVADVLAKANEPKSADRFQGIAAETVSERIAAKVVLSNLTVLDITENPLIDPAKDEVSRVILDSLNTTIYNEIKGFTIGELREIALSHKYNGDALLRLSKGMCAEVIAGIAKLCSSMDLVYGASKINVVTHCNTAIGQRGTLSYRCQPNHPTDDIDGIIVGLMEGLSYGCGDACLGINPVDDSVENIKLIMNAINDFMLKWEIPTQTVVLGHVTTQMAAVEAGAPASMIFQSIAGTQAANEDFGVNHQLLLDAYDLISHQGTSKGPNLLYFETGQGSEVSIGADEGVDEMTLESRTYGFGRVFSPFMVNNVSGFIGPETLYDGKEMIRANLEDHFMAKLHGLPMGMAPCYTNHTGIDQNDQEIATMLLAMAGCNYYMGVPGADDVMLSYQDTSYQDDATLRELLCYTPAPDFFKWMQKMGLMDSCGKLTALGGDASVFM